MVSTYFALMAEFQTAEIPLELIGKKYFGLNEIVAKRHATLNRLPVPAFRGGSQKSSWLVHVGDLASWIDDERSKAKLEWEKSQKSI